MNNPVSLFRKYVTKIKGRIKRAILKNKYGNIGDLYSSVPSRVEQMMLAFNYKEYLQNGFPLPDFRDVGFRANSQTDEDGILLYIFSILGTTNKKVIEMCAGDGIECNSANLLIKHGWNGVLVDGNSKKLDRGRYFYQTCKDTVVHPPNLVCAWIDCENVNELIDGAGFSGDVDLFSLDMDGVDYWIWDALKVVSPRVMVVEYQSMWGANRSVTVPYSKEFSRTNLNPDYFGASLSAFNCLANKKGYRLVGCNTLCFNAFFVRNDVACPFPTIPVRDCFFHHRLSKEHLDDYSARMKNYPWVEIDEKHV
jgi:hypothetical protein